MRWLTLCLLPLLAVPTIFADEKDELAAKQKALALNTLKKCNVPMPGLIETTDLIVCGSIPNDKLKLLGEAVQKQFTYAAKSLKFEANENQPKGKIIVYFFPERKYFASFFADAVKERLERDDRSYATSRGSEASVAVSVLPGENPTDLDVEAGNQIAIVLLQAKAGVAKLPDWMEDGFARAVRLRTDPRLAPDRALIKKILFGKSKYSVKDAWSPSAEKERQLLAASLMEYFVFGPTSASLGKLLGGFKVPEGDPKPSIDAVLTGVELTPDKLDLAWKKWVLTGK